MDPSWYPVIKALHLIFMVTFFAGTFYIVRLFIYHTEAFDRWEPERGVLAEQFALMSRRLWYFITWPSLVLMALFGIWMLVLNPELLKQPWMHAKLGLVSLLIAYHMVNQGIFSRLQRNERAWRGSALRLWNEGATLILFGVVFLAVLKRVQWYYGLIGLGVLGGVLVLAVNMYRRKRRDDARTGGPGA